MKKLIIITGIAILAAGCTTGQQWSGKTEVDFKRDYYECMREFRQIGSKYARNVPYENRCLEGRGYTNIGDSSDSYAIWKQK